MKHKQKRHIARKMMTKMERAAGVALFSSAAWMKRRRLRKLKHDKRFKRGNEEGV